VYRSRAEEMYIAASGSRLFVGFLDVPYPIDRKISFDLILQIIFLVFWVNRPWRGLTQRRCLGWVSSSGLGQWSI